jgi:hypothetical protein
VKFTVAEHVPGALPTEMLAGQEMVGGCVSFTVTVKLHVAVWPAASVAVDITVVVPTGKTEPEAGLLTTVTPGQLSAAVTLKFTVAEHWPAAAGCTMLAGQVMIGFCVSLTVTVKLQVAVRPAASVAVELTVVVPTGKALPEAGTLTTVTPGQLSAALTVKFTTAEHWPGVLFTVMFAGQVMVGFCVSVTVTVKLHTAVFPEASVAVAFTVVVPTGKDEPEAGLATTVTPGQLSFAPTVKLTVAEHVPGALPTEMLAGQEMVGACVSFTVTVKLHVAEPPLFWAVQSTVVAPTGKTCGDVIVVAPILH